MPVRSWPSKAPWATGPGNRHADHARRNESSRGVLLASFLQHSQRAGIPGRPGNRPRYRRMAPVARGAHSATRSGARPAAPGVYRPVRLQRGARGSRRGRDSKDRVREASLHGVARWGGGAMNPDTVGIHRVADMERYGALRAPFDPDAPYPELAGTTGIDGANFVFREFRQFMSLLGWDAATHSTPGWNPLGWLVRPGDTVLIKPNLVVSEHPGGDDLVRCTDTDGPVLRCVAEYVLVALRGRGRLIVGDSPIKETDFAKATALTGVEPVVETLRRGPVPVELIDFRDFVSRKDEVAMVEGRMQPGDPRGYTEFDLGRYSE